jgi:hypothetical protein
MPGDSDFNSITGFLRTGGKDCDLRRSHWQCRWLRVWRQLGSPRISFDLHFSGGLNGEAFALLGNTGLIAYFGGHLLRRGHYVFHPVKIETPGGRDVTVLLGRLSGLRHERGCLLSNNPAERLFALSAAADALVAAHFDAAWGQDHVEAMRALDLPDVGERVAALEERLFGDIVPDVDWDTYPADREYSAPSQHPRL